MRIAQLPINYLTGAQAARLVREDKASVGQVVEDHLKRYDARDDAIQAWAYFDKERAMAEAKRLDAVPLDQRGPLHGIIVGVKDMMHTKDMPTQHGSKAYKGHFPQVDAPAVAVCRAAGALIYGKTHTTEFASTPVGPPTRNAWDQKRTPGGSSSGSAAAVGDWQCHVAFGTQTGGSVIRPASFNGVFGFKPTWGIVSREGLKISSLTLDTFGMFARSVADLKLFAQVLHIEDDVRPTAKPLSECSFAYIKTEQWAAKAPEREVVAAWEKSKQLLQDAGAKVVEIELPTEFDGLSLVKHGQILEGEHRSNFLAEYVTARDALHPMLVGLVENAKGLSRKALRDAQDSVAALRPVFDRIASEYEAIVTPSVPGAAPVGTEWTGDYRFCCMWSALHVPVINVPGFASDDGAPVGLSLVAPRYEDYRLLAVAEEVAKVWVDADADKYIPAVGPEGIKHAEA